jgi:hypothetical protein
MAINRSSFGKSLWPGINKWYGEAYKEFPEEYKQLFGTYGSTKAFEEDVGTSGLGLANVLNEGEAVSYDSMQQGFVTRYNHVKYGLGFIITQEMIDDDQYMIVAQKRSRALAMSLRQTKEIVGANVYNRAFNSSYTGGDAKELCATDHPNVAGGTYANELTTAADLSEAALEQAVIDLMSFTNDRGLKISVMPTKLVIPSALIFEADRILKSPLRVSSDNNDINALKLGGWIPNVTVNHYLTDSDAWFLLTNVQDGMKYFERKADSFSEDNDFDTDNLKYKAVARYSFGWTDPRGIFGSPGA